MKNAPICLFHLDLFGEKFIRNILGSSEVTSYLVVENEKLKTGDEARRVFAIQAFLISSSSLSFLLFNNFMSVEI